MKPVRIRPALCLKGEVSLLGDKSIAHRALIVSALSQSSVMLRNFPLNADCLYTLKVFKTLGVKIEKRPAHGLLVSGKGLFGLRPPRGDIYAGESGTTFRLLAGILSGQDFVSRLTAAPSLARRPMSRVTIPLRRMGASITAKKQKAEKEEYPPLIIRGGELKPIDYRMPVASAQVKSALLFAGLYASGETKIFEPVKTRDHTERMLKLFKAAISTRGNRIVLRGRKELSGPAVIDIPGDISSAAFFMAAAAILPGSRVLLKNISLNPSRMGVVKVLQRMGAQIEISPAGNKFSAYEPVGDVLVRGSVLKAATVTAEEVPSLIDELPVLFVTACFARGRTLFQSAGELRVKETDRIKSVSENLAKMGAEIRVVKNAGSEDILIKGVSRLKGARVESFGDHRTAMSMAVAGLAAEGVTVISGPECVKKSFPGFFPVLKLLTKN